MHSLMLRKSNISYIQVWWGCCFVSCLGFRSISHWYQLRVACNWVYFILNRWVMTRQQLGIIFFCVILDHFNALLFSLSVASAKCCISFKLFFFFFHLKTDANENLIFWHLILKLIAKTLCVFLRLLKRFSCIFISKNPLVLFWIGEKDSVSFY